MGKDQILPWQNIAILRTQPFAKAQAHFCPSCPVLCKISSIFLSFAPSSVQRIVFGLLDSQTREGKISPMTFLYWNKVSLLLTSDVSVELVTVCVQFATIGGLEIRTVRHNLCSALHSVVSKDTTLCNAEQRLWDFPPSETEDVLFAKPQI